VVGWEDSNFQPNDYQSLALSSRHRWPVMARASLASPTCRRNGPDSASLRSNRTHTRTESLGSGLCARKRNFCGRDETAETVSLKFNWPFAENSFGHFAMHEIPTRRPLVNA